MCPDKKETASQPKVFHVEHPGLRFSDPSVNIASHRQHRSNSITESPSGRSTMCEPRRPHHQLSNSIDSATVSRSELEKPRRRLSAGSSGSGAGKSFLVDVSSTKDMLLSQEDMDGDSQITIDDHGPKTLKLGSLSSNGIFKYDVQGTYLLSNLLQELSIAEDQKLKRIVVREELLSEDPVKRLTRLIQWWFWPGLLRKLDVNGIENAVKDTKSQIEKNAYIYVPHDDPIAYHYYMQVAKMKPELRLVVCTLPKDPTPDYIHSLRDKPGILSLGLRPKKVNTAAAADALDPYFLQSCQSSAVSLKSYATISTFGTDLVNDYEGLPFLVPGGRFNEMYGWDSYFIVLGLLLCEPSPEGPKLANSSSSHPSTLEHHHLKHHNYTKYSLKYDPLDLCRSMVDNLVYEIDHYGKILNANRTYYLGRSQPPFLTDMMLRVYERLVLATDGGSGSGNEDTREWLASCLRAATKEYKSVWMAAPRYDAASKLSRYHPEGMRMPCETEPGHFDSALAPFACRRGLSLDQFVDAYQEGRLSEPELDEYFLHDRAVRESGHDTTYRMEGMAAHLATVDLNCLLYKYEMDIAAMLESYYPAGLTVSIGSDSYIEAPEVWRAAALRRKRAMNKYCWDAEQRFYFDYHTLSRKRIAYESVTAFWTLWCGIASPEQAQALVSKHLSKFEEAGGLVCGTEASRGAIGPGRPSRQWDYPYGWPPHQILAWEGLCRYGYQAEARRLAYRWLYMMTKAFVDYNGVVPEKFDVVRSSHKFSVEYGNVGVDFKYIPREGFGWMNSSYQIGLTLITASDRKALGALIPPKHLFKSAK